MRLSFELSPPRSRDAVRGLFEAMASTLVGRSVSLQRTEYRGEDDRNGEGLCFVAKWTDGPITYEESLLNGSGNPRDRWGYELRLTLTLPQVTLRAGGDQGDFRSFTVVLEGTGRQWLALRKTLRRELGEKNDRSSTPWIAHEVLPALTAEGEAAEALALGRESLAGSEKKELYRDQIVAWLAANDPSSGGPAMRVREAPGVLEGWLALERSGDTSLTEVFARLCPYELTRWKAAGLPPGPWFAHPAWPLDRDPSDPGPWKTIHLTADHVWPSFVNSLSAALVGWSVGTDWQDVAGDWREGVDGWHWRTARRARVPVGATLPVVHVTLSGVRREPDEWKLDWEELMSRKFKETLTWSWIGSQRTGDALVIVERALPKRPNGTPESAGITFTVVGTSEFRERAEAAVIATSHLRWYPVDASQSLDPWTPRATSFPDARSALQATVSPERFARAEELLRCRCLQPGIGACEHRRELLGYAREDQRGETPEASARSAAWNAAFYSVGDRPELESMNRNLADAYRAHVRAAEYVA